VFFPAGPILSDVNAFKIISGDEMRGDFYVPAGGDLTDFFSLFRNEKNKKELV
jgi:hypothetical protein